MRDWVKYSIVLAAVTSFTGLVLHLHTLAWAGGVYAAGAVLYAFLSMRSFLRGLLWRTPPMRTMRRFSSDRSS